MISEMQRRMMLLEQGYWEIPDDLDTSNFDFSWRPDPWDRPYIHQFGTQWQKTGGPRFVVPENEGIKYQSHQHAIRLPRPESRNFRILKPNVQFDYSWHPDDTDPPYIYVFGNQWYDCETMPTVQYRVKGATEKKYIKEVRARLEPCMDRWIIPDDIEGFDYSWVPHPYDPPMIHQFGTQWQKTGGPRYVVENATVVKYNDAQKATKLPNMRVWRIPEDIEEGFDFSWHPEETDEPYIYEFATQHQKNGGPLYVTKGATKIKYTNDQIAIRKHNRRGWRVIENIVDDFDFSWHPDNTEDPYIYVFGNELYSPEIMPTVMYTVRGATVQKPITTLKAKLKNFEVCNYEDSLFDAVMSNSFNNKYVHFKRIKETTLTHTDFLDGSLSLHVFNGTEALVPRDCKAQIYDKLTDYREIKYHIEGDEPELLDIIFFSNGEECAEDNYKHLLSLRLPNRIVRVDGVKGRVASQYAAAHASNTPWYFLVNAKLRINEEFDFEWQPDRLKSRRHYIFRAKNPINGLVYGHMAMVANNRKLTLETKGTGLDFTMESPHETVNILSGEAVFNSEWDVWRTSFRESIKLCHAQDAESKERLRIWTTVAEGDFAQSCLQGAKDAVEYYESVNGDFEKLKLSYDWAWLREKFNK